MAGFYFFDLFGEENLPQGKGIDLRLRSLRDGYSGLQASLRNISDGPMNGVQVSIWGNYASDLRGLQLGLVNSAEVSRGVQAGGLNVIIEDNQPRSLTLQLGILNLRIGKNTPWYAKAIPGFALRFPKR